MILDEIVENKWLEVEAGKRRVPLSELKRRAGARAPARDFAGALTGGGLKLIAEVKKASPSRGIIREDFDPVHIAQIYAQNGAAALSVLTDEKYFGGKQGYLVEIRRWLGQTTPPLLRKDFIIDPYQAYESRAYGADAILLIAAILAPGMLGELLQLSQSLGMACLVEVHNEAELRVALQSEARIIGINNRDLTTMKTDLSTAERLRPLIPPGRIVVSESGIHTRADMMMMERLGVNAVLIGEALIAAPDIAGKIRELYGQG
jgi:indole-3-glycerol phosphate synthase